MKNYISVVNITFLLILIFPLSIVAGNFILNLNILLIDIIGLFLIYQNRKKIKIDESLKYLLIFFIYLIFSSFFSKYQSTSILKSLFFFKFFVFTLILIHIFELKQNYFKLFHLSLIFCLIFLSLDGLLQRFTGSNIFGWPMQSNRMTGLFKDEAVIGSYLSKFLFFGITYFYIFKDKVSKKKSFEIFILLITFFAIINSGERMATIHTLIGMTAYLLINLITYKKKFFLIFIFLIVCIGFSLNNTTFKYRFNETFENKYGIGKSFQSFKDSHWGAHYLTSIEIYKDNLLFGSGLKTFRIVCNDYDQIDSKKKNQRCSTHSHNYVLEMLSEIGTIGILLFLLFLYHLFAPLNFKNRITYIILIPPLIYLWPLGTSGSFFSSFNGTFFFIMISIIVTIKKFKY